MIAMNARDADFKRLLAIADRQIPKRLDPDLHDDRADEVHSLAVAMASSANQRLTAAAA